MLSVPGQHPQQQQAFPPQMQQPGLMHHPQTPQHNRHISPMNARTTPQPPHHQVQIPGGPPPHSHPQAAYYNTPTGPRPSPMPSGAIPPSAKRYKPSPANVPHPSVAAAAAQAAALGAVGGDPVMTIDEEEDTSRGDILDHFSPREIAQTRYTQHHEWMEEVIGSAYPINRITPVDLGLGLAGELEKVTKGILDPPIFPTPKARINDPVKEPKDPKETLAALDSRATEMLSETEEEIRQLELAHSKRMEKIRATSIYRDAELELRGGLGIEHLIPGFNLPHTLDGDSDSEDATTATARPVSPVRPGRTVEEIMRDIERATGRKIVPAQPVVKYELPADEIVKMGGVFAQDIHQHQHQHHHQQHIDTVMEDDHTHVTTLDDDATFKLDIPTPPTESPMPATDGLLEEFQTHEDANLGVMEDTIMADFMNVDDMPSKPATPQGAEQHLTPGVPIIDAGGSVGAASSTGEDLFTIPPMDGTPSVVGTPSLDLGVGSGQ
ncbi:DUF1750-domain-containing protein [Wilcoxina mikolae CBS 423.85]|nr:DUF1750-domain-containing protein [Wilcoxina mikolae CBS 423.85]